MIRLSFTNTNVAVPNYPMKAITLWQPWASLIIAGAKGYETRAWMPWPSLKVGDPIAIHAAKRESERIAELSPYIYRITTGWNQLPTGAVLGYGFFQGAIKTDDANVSRQERKLGDWSPGRYAWRITNVHVFTEPVPAKGAQGLWTWQP